jgi:hypothetical protein
VLVGVISKRNPHLRDLPGRPWPVDHRNVLGGALSGRLLRLAPSPAGEVLSCLPRARTGRRFLGGSLGRPLSKRPRGSGRDIGFCHRILSVARCDARYTSDPRPPLGPDDARARLERGDGA